MATYYVHSENHKLVPSRTASTAYSIGDIVKNSPDDASLQTSTTYGRCFRCTTAGTTSATANSGISWPTTKNGTVTDGTVVWTECTGEAIYNGDGGGSAWGAPYYSIMGFQSGAVVNNDVIYVGETHNGTFSGLNVNFLISNTAPGTAPKIICVPDSTIPPTASTTGARERTTTSGNLGVLTNGSPSAYFEGISLEVQHTASSTLNLITGGGWGYFKNCNFRVGNNSGSVLTVGSSSTAYSGVATTIFENCTFRFGNAASSINIKGGVHRLKNCTFFDADATLTGCLFRPTTTGTFSYIEMESCYIVNGSFTNGIVDMTGGDNRVYLKMSSCFISQGITGVVPNSSSLSGDEYELQMYDCNTANQEYSDRFETISGKSIQSTSTVKTGGASSGTGFSFKVDTNASGYVSNLRPFIVPIGGIYNTATTTKTITVDIASTATLKDNEVWMEVIYKNDGASSKTETKSTFSGVISSGTNLASSSASWSGSQSSFQKLTTTITPTFAGYIEVRVCVGKASTTLYVDPLIQIT